MFSQLIESSPRSKRPVAQGLISLAFHVVIGVGAVEATRRVVSEPSSTPRVVAIVAPASARPLEPRPVEARSSASASALPDQPVFVAAPTVMPTGLPPIELGASIDASRFVIGPPTAPGCVGCTGVDSTAAGSIFSEETVDQPVDVIEQPKPVYPAVLRTAGISGRVIVEFVVDTSGLVERESIRILEATNASFGESARLAVLDSKFRPARARGELVRQLVRQAIGFRIQ